MPLLPRYRCLYSTWSKVNSLKYLHNAKPVNKKVEVQGWVKAIRKQKEVMFLDIDDGSGSQVLQVTAKPGLKTAELTSGSVISVQGEIVPHPKQNIELSARNIEILGPFETDKFPFRLKGENSFDDIRQHLHLRPYAKVFQSFLKVRSEATMSLHNYFQNNGYHLIHTPILTSNDCEGGGEIFEIRAADREVRQEKEPNKSSVEKVEYFDHKVYLTVSGQLQLESVVCGGLSKVYTLGPSFRAENTRTRRHLSEFYMLEAELAFTRNLDDILKVIEDMLKNVTKNILAKCCNELNQLQNHPGVNRHEDNVRKLVDSPFGRCSYSEAINILSRNEKFANKIQWGTSLHKEHEDFIVKYFGNIPVFVTDFPAASSPFYMKSNLNETNTAASVDLLVPTVGELVGGSLREDNLDVLKKNLLKLKSSASLEWYIDLRRFGSVPHGGFGMGFERYLQFITGIANIRDAIPFPRWTHHCAL